MSVRWLQVLLLVTAVSALLVQLSSQCLDHWPPGEKPTPPRKLNLIKQCVSVVIFGGEIIIIPLFPTPETQYRYRLS